MSLSQCMCAKVQTVNFMHAVSQLKIYSWCFETRSHSVAHPGLELTHYVPRPIFCFCFCFSFSSQRSSIFCLLITDTFISTTKSVNCVGRHSSVGEHTFFSTINKQTYKQTNKHSGENVFAMQWWWPEIRSFSTQVKARFGILESITLMLKWWKQVVLRNLLTSQPSQICASQESLTSARM